MVLQERNKLKGGETTLQSEIRGNIEESKFRRLETKTGSHLQTPQQVKDL